MDADKSNLPNKLRAKFFKDDGSRAYVEITIVGDPNSVIRKVTPEDSHRFPREWAAFEQGNAEAPITGTPLTEIPGVDRDASLNLRLKGVRTAEELAGLDESAAKGLGMGGLTFWKAARNLIRLKELEAAAEAPRRGRPPKPDAETPVA